jgi:hypothetical protein
LNKFNISFIFVKSKGDKETFPEKEVFRISVMQGWHI